MFYKICRFVNITISCLLLMLLVASVIRAKNFPSEVIIILSIVFISSSFFLLFNYICSKLYKHNDGQIVIPQKLRSTGKIIFAFNLVGGIAVCILAIAALSTFLSNDSEIMRRLWVFYYTIFFLLALAGITAIINLFFFASLLKKNKAITLTIIDDIGK